MKNTKTTLFLMAFSLFLISSCAKIYYSPDAYSLANNHKIIAIAPPSVSIAASKKVDAEAIKEQQKTESINFQKEIYAWMLKRKLQGQISPEILDIETTIAKLSRAGYPETPYSPSEICDILGVDGIITSNFSMSKPMSEGAAIALGLLTGAWGSTNEVNVSMSIFDNTNKKLIWNFDHQYTGGVGSSPSSLVDDLMRYASKKMPYLTSN